MSTMRRRSGAVLIALALLLGVAAAPAGATTLQRKWTASFGANGWVTLRAYTNGRGFVAYDLKGLRANAIYSVSIREGTCSKLGTTVARLAPLRVTAAGTVSRLAWVVNMQMYYIWQAARSPSFVVRIVSGTSIKCAAFTFPHATRVSVSGLGIDIAVIRGNNNYPLCDVAMYSPLVAQPREPGITFIFAHARTGMFLPLLTRWRIDRGTSLIGRTVYVWTSDNFRSTYKIDKVRVTKDAMAGTTSLAAERLWLQTSTGPNTSYPKLVVEAHRISTAPASYAASHPVSHAHTCPGH
jgi:hypothetical protein